MVLILVCFFCFCCISWIFLSRKPLVLLPLLTLKSLVFSFSLLEIRAELGAGAALLYVYLMVFSASSCDLPMLKLSVLLIISFWYSPMRFSYCSIVISFSSSSSTTGSIKYYFYSDIEELNELTSSSLILSFSLNLSLI